MAQQAPPTCDSAQHQQFDFWVGDWRVETPSGQHAGDNTIRKSLNSCVLEENWRGAGGSIGKSFNMYFRGDDQWHQTWVDGTGGRLDLAGGFDGDSMVLRGTVPGQNGAAVEHEIRFTPNEKGEVTQHWRASSDGGATWSDQFLGIYKRAGTR